MELAVDFLKCLIDEIQSFHLPLRLPFSIPVKPTWLGMLRWIVWFEYEEE